METPSPKPVLLSAEAIAIEQVEAVARRNAEVRLDPGRPEAIKRARSVVEACLEDGEAHYGINTGFGSLSRKRIPEPELEELQRNLIRSHAAGVLDPLPRETVRAMMLCLAGSLARGFSGIRLEVIELLIGMLNAGVTPRVPSIGSVGASGDLAPLAHLALVLMGEGEADFGGRTLGGGEALAQAGLAPVSLSAKEGLALINGTHLMAGEAALLTGDLGRLLDAGALASALSLDACKGSYTFLDHRIYRVRNHPGPASAAAKMRELLAGSEIGPSHRFDDPRVQDPYSLRCAAYVLGAACDAVGSVKLAATRELGAVTDNPLVFGASPDGPEDIISAGNFHGMPIAIPLDHMGIAIAHVAGISERRTFLMLSALDPESGLTPYLTRQPGVQSGLMIAQYTAAACCNELIGLANPASVANIPTSAGIEDYNSFGPRSAAKARRGLVVARRVLAIELLCAAEAIEHHRPLKTGAKLEQALTLIRARVEPWTTDRSPAPDIEALAEAIADGVFEGLLESPLLSEGAP